ncbi:MAG: DUF881 domain-containing protein [Candidatus Gracilibacteria bacterium]
MKYRIKYHDLTIIITGILLGFLVVLQSRSFGGVQDKLARDSRANVFREIQILKTTNENLGEEIADLEVQLAKASDQELALKALQDEIVKDKIIAGHVDVNGPGVELTIKNNLPALWFTDIVNELWSAGAEAISVNDVRLTNSSVGFDTLPNGQISLNGVILTAPYHFRGIGEKKVLSEALSQPGGIVQRIKESVAGAEITIDQKDVIPMEKVL